MISSLAPGGAPVSFVEPLQTDECKWFLRAVQSELVAFRECAADCPRRVKHGMTGPDEFLNTQGRYRHLFSSPGASRAWLNREYVPHIAAFGRAVLEFGFDARSSLFSTYRSYSRDLITKKSGGHYETDVEFYDADGRLFLHVEAKTKPSGVEKIAAQLDRAADLSELPLGVVKEMEYVLDLAPRYLWILGPGSVEPAKHTFEVTVSGMSAQFHRVDALPSAASME